MSKKIQTNPRLLTHVLQAVADLKENAGSNVRHILDQVQTAINISNVRPKPRNIVMQVKKAIRHGIETGVLKSRGGRIRLALGIDQQRSNGLRKACDMCGGKRKKRRSNECGGQKPRKCRLHAKKRSGGGSKKSVPRKKKITTENPSGKTVPDSETVEQQQTTQYAEETAQCNNVPPHQDIEEPTDRRRRRPRGGNPTQKRRRSKRRSGRHARQATPQIEDKQYTGEFIPQERHVPQNLTNITRKISRSRSRPNSNHNQSPEYVNNKFGQNEVHESRECDNPECLCNIKQEPVDKCEHFQEERDNC